jgi:hypothetical protein
MSTDQRTEDESNGWLLLHRIRPWLEDYATMMNESATDPKLAKSLRDLAKARYNEVIQAIRKIP